MPDPIAIYGAAIGTFAAVGVGWNIYDSAIRDSARLKIILGREFTPDGSEYRIITVNPKAWRETEASYPKAPRRGLVTVTNIGKRPTTVMEAGFEFVDGMRAAFQPGISGGQLDQGQWTSFGISEGALSEIVRNKGLPRFIYAQDASMKMHRISLNKELRPWLTQLRDTKVNLEKE